MYGSKPDMKEQLEMLEYCSTISTHFSFGDKSQGWLSTYSSADYDDDDEEDYGLSHHVLDQLWYTLR